MVTKSEAIAPFPQPQPKGFQIHGTSEEMKQFDFLTKFDERELPQQVKGYIALLSSEADRLINAKAFNETWEGEHGLRGDAVRRKNGGG